MDRKWRHADFSARWRRRSKISADSERRSPISYLRLIITFGLSLTVSELLVFVCGPEMTSCRLLRQVASKAKGQCGFWMAVPNFLLMINYNFWSISYRFRVTSICLWTGNDIMTISPLVSVVGRYLCRFRKVVPDFLFAINYNFWSISYRFRVISICLWTGNDVMMVSLLGGVVCQRSIRILKGSPRLPICD